MSDSAKLRILIGAIWLILGLALFAFGIVSICLIIFSIFPIDLIAVTIFLPIIAAVVLFLLASFNFYDAGKHHNS